MTIDECTDMLWAASRADNILNDRPNLVDGSRDLIRDSILHLHLLGGVLETATIHYLHEKEDRAKMGTWRVSMKIPDLCPEEDCSGSHLDYSVAPAKSTT